MHRGNARSGGRRAVEAVDDLPTLVEGRFEEARPLPVDPGDLRCGHGHRLGVGRGRRPVRVVGFEEDGARPGRAEGLRLPRVVPRRRGDAHAGAVPVVAVDDSSDEVTAGIAVVFAPRERRAVPEGADPDGRWRGDVTGEIAHDDEAVLPVRRHGADRQHLHRHLRVRGDARGDERGHRLIRVQLQRETGCDRTLRLSPAEGERRRRRRREQPDALHGVDTVAGVEVEAVVGDDLVGHQNPLRARHTAVGRSLPAGDRQTLAPCAFGTDGVRIARGGVVGDAIRLDHLDGGRDDSLLEVGFGDVADVVDDDVRARVGEREDVLGHVDHPAEPGREQNARPGRDAVHDLRHPASLVAAARVVCENLDGRVVSAWVAGSGEHAGRNVLRGGGGRRGRGGVRIGQDADRHAAAIDVEGVAREGRLQRLVGVDRDAAAALGGRGRGSRGGGRR